MFVIFPGKDLCRLKAHEELRALRNIHLTLFEIAFMHLSAGGLIPAVTP